MWNKSCSVSYAFTVCFRHITLDTPVMIRSWSHIIALFPMKCPCLAVTWLVVNHDLGTWGAQRSFIEIKIAEKIGPCRQVGIDSGVAEEVESELALVQDPVPFSDRERWVTRG